MMKLNLHELDAETAARSLLAEQLIEAGATPEEAMSGVESWFDGLSPEDDNPVRNMVQAILDIAQELERPMAAEIVNETTADKLVSDVYNLPWKEDQQEAALKVMNAVSTQSPDRVMDQSGSGYHPQTGPGRMLMPHIKTIFIRDDGWTLGVVDDESALKAIQTWGDNFIGVMQSPSVVVRFQDWLQEHPEHLWRSTAMQ